MSSTEVLVSTATLSSTACLDNSPNSQDQEWLETLRTKGWTIVPETIPKDKALKYADKAYSWLEDWGYGFNRTDPATRGPAHLPFTHRAGIFNRFGVAHEQFMWDLKSEPSLIDKFARVWGTDELLVSYDGINLSLPVSERPKTDPIFAPWSHVDQSPLRSGLQCVQGILNLLPNGPDDGGLMVLEGSSKYYAELWQHFDHKKGENGWNTWEQQFLDEEMCSWLESKGCKFAAYVCYKPASMVSDEAKEKRKEAWENKDCTAHDPSIIRLTPRLPPDTHHSYQQAVERPLQEPVLTLRGKQLAGLASY
ncbi:hypothetical protein K4K54_011477 [Colletotrichum sp. SAR 10_86]|nr:hypothetical protein K4K54_011477 [Colletotrichum sp. SAR 10_86]KAI8261234.1 hypothetical protein K4K53_000940 [Colletotrichum sp. SAR 10_77]